MELQVVPSFAVRTSPDIAVIPRRRGRDDGRRSRGRTIEVTVTNQQKGPANATVT